MGMLRSGLKSSVHCAGERRWQKRGTAQGFRDIWAECAPQSGRAVHTVPAGVGL